MTTNKRQYLTYGPICECDNPACKLPLGLSWAQYHQSLTSAWDLSKRISSRCESLKAYSVESRALMQARIDSTQSTQPTNAELDRADAETEVRN